MSRIIPTRADLSELLKLAAPVVGVQVGIMLMGVVDTAMVGRVSAGALAGAALGNLYFWSVCGFMMGLLMSLDPLVTQAIGAGDARTIRRSVQRGTVMATGLSLIAAGLMFPASAVLEALGQPPELAAGAGQYVRISIPGIWPFLMFGVLRQVLQAMHKLRSLVMTILVANAANAVLNWTLIFGHFGFEPMGLAGAAWATAVSRWIMTLVLAGAAWRQLGPDFWPWDRAVWRPGPMWAMVKIGVPIGVTISLEAGAFTVVALFMGSMGETTIAAHQIALVLASFTFMVPLGVGQAATVRVGRAIGAGDLSAARRAALAAFYCGGGFMLGAAALFLVAPRVLARSYTQDPAVIELATRLIPLAGLFQVFDGLQAVGAGVLRGAGDTRAPMVINLMGFWLIGLSTSLLLAYVAGWGAIGLWWGFVAGLAVVATLLVLRSRAKLSREVRRTLVDHGA